MKPGHHTRRAAREAYRAERYPGDLAADLGLDGPAGRIGSRPGWRWAAGLAAAAAVVGLVAVGVWRPGSGPEGGPGDTGGGVAVLPGGSEMTDPEPVHGNGTTIVAPEINARPTASRRSAAGWPGLPPATRRAGGPAAVMTFLERVDRPTPTRRLRFGRPEIGRPASSEPAPQGSRVPDPHPPLTETTV